MPKLIIKKIFKRKGRDQRCIEQELKLVDFVEKNSLDIACRYLAAYGSKFRSRIEWLYGMEGANELLKNLGVGYSGYLISPNVGIYHRSNIGYNYYPKVAVMYVARRIEMMESILSSSKGDDLEEVILKARLINEQLESIEIMNDNYKNSLRVALVEFLKGASIPCRIYERDLIYGEGTVRDLSNILSKESIPGVRHESYVSYIEFTNVDFMQLNKYIENNIDK